MKTWQGNSYKGKAISDYIVVQVIPLVYDTNTIKSRVKKRGKQYSFKIEAKNNVEKIGVLLQEFLEEQE